MLWSLLSQTAPCLYPGLQSCAADWSVYTEGERLTSPAPSFASAVTTQHALLAQRTQAQRLSGPLRERLQKQYFVDEQHDIISFHNTAPSDSALPPRPAWPGPAQHSPLNRQLRTLIHSLIESSYRRGLVTGSGVKLHLFICLPAEASGQDQHHTLEVLSCFRKGTGPKWQHCQNKLTQK